MADTNDTIDGLLAEFRGYAAGMPPSYHVTTSWADFRRMLDRFDAAHKREVDNIHRAMVILAGIEMPNPDYPPRLWTALEDAYDALSDALGTDGCTTSDEEEAKATGRHFVIQPRGDCAKLREALVQAELFVGNIVRHGHQTLVPGDKCTACDGADELRDMICAALSAPPRNCDLPEVAKDPWRAWLDDKFNWDEFGNPKLEIHDWLLAPATEKEGGAK